MTNSIMNIWFTSYN